MKKRIFALSVLCAALVFGQYAGRFPGKVIGYFKYALGAIPTANLLQWIDGQNNNTNILDRIPSDLNPRYGWCFSGTNLTHSLRDRASEGQGLPPADLEVFAGTPTFGTNTGGAFDYPYVSFDGSTRLTYDGSAEELNTSGNPFTMFTWVRWATNPPSTETFFLTQRISGGGGNRQALTIRNTGEIRASNGSSGGTIVGSVLTSNVWNLVALEVSGDGKTGTLYLNNETPVVNAQTTSVYTTDLAKVWVGSGNSGQEFNGDIGCTRIYQSEWSEKLQEAAYAQGGPVDSVDATLETTLDLHPMNGSCLSLNGSTDYINWESGANDSGQFGACTISLWVNLDVTTGTRAFWGHGVGAYRLALISNELYINSFTTGVAPPAAGEWFQYVVKYTADGGATNMVIYDVDGNVESSWTGSIATASPSGDPSFQVGAKADIWKLQGDIFGFESTSTNLPSWRIMEGAGTTVYDTEGNDNNGTIVAGTWATQDVSFENYFEGFSYYDYFPTNERTSFVILGDSLTAFNGDGWEGGGNISSIGYFNWMRAYLDYAVDLKAERGYSGYRTDEILTNVTEAASFDPDYMIVCAGYNDIFQGVSSGTIITNLDAIKNAIETNNIIPIFLTPPPAINGTLSATKKAQATAVRDHIKTYERYVDIFEALADGSGDSLAGTTFDAVHWSERGANLVGRTVAPTINSLIKPAKYVFYDEAEAPNAHSDPDFNDSAGWANFNSTKAIITEDNRNKLQLTSTADGRVQAYYVSNISDGYYAAGDRVQFIADIGWEIADRAADDVASRPYMLFYHMDTNGVFQTSINMMIISTNEVVEGLSTPTNRGVFMSPVVTVSNDIDRIYTYVGFEDCSTGDVITVHNMTMYDVDEAASYQAPRYPAVNGSTTLDARGDTLNVPPAGLNRTFIPWEGDLVQADAHDVIDHSGLWHDATTNLLEVSYADAKAWVSGNDSTWVDFYLDEEGIAIGRFNLIYEESNSFSLAEYNSFSNSYPNAYGAGIIVYTQP